MINKRSIFILGAVFMFSLFAGCTNLMEEDPNSQQTPWAGPAGWENQMPGMPNQGF